VQFFKKTSSQQARVSKGDSIRQNGWRDLDLNASPSFGSYRFHPKDIIFTTATNFGCQKDL